MTDMVAPYDCQSCGACCAYSAEWPRFTLEPDEWLDQIPPALVAADSSGMKFDNGRCAALSGEIGKQCACTLYLLRPQVCRDCMPGDPECLIARADKGLPIL